MRPRLVGLLAGLAAAAIITMIVTRQGDPYPMPAGPVNASQANPIEVGMPVWAVLVYLEPRPGDRIELLGAEPVGLAAGAQITFHLSRPVVEDDGTRVIGEALEPIEGAVIETPAGASPGPDNLVGIVGELTPSQPGIYELTAVRLRFRLNGGGEEVREGTSEYWTVCADDPAPTDCEASSPTS
jgi:hypothetical protein